MPGRGSGTSITLADGQHTTIPLRMLRGAVVAGTIMNELGQPAQLSMQLLQYRTVDGQRTLVSVVGGYGYVSSDDRGQYRLFGVPPGEYIVAASPPLGIATSTRQTTAADIQWAMRQLQGSAAGAAPDATPPPAQPAVGVPIYYPGTVDLAAAAPVVLRAGEERLGVDFTVQLVPSARIEGTIVDPDGRPATSAQIILMHKTLQPGDYVMSTTVGNRQATNGRISMTNIAPGTYSIFARAVRGSGAASSILWATTDVIVAGRDVSDVALTLEPGISLAGKLVFDGSLPGDITRTRVAIASAAGGASTVSLPPIAPAADGTFSFSGLIPGRYRVMVTLPDTAPGGGPAAWMVRSIRAGSQEAADLPLEIVRGEPLPEIVVTLTDRPAEISGLFQDAAGAPASGVSIVLLPADKRLWIAGARRVRAVRPTSDGRYRMTGLPAGEYLLAAVAAVDSSDLSDTSFLDTLAAGALKFTLDEGEKKVQDLRRKGS
jgi:hypothetical protein